MTKARGRLRKETTACHGRAFARPVLRSGRASRPGANTILQDGKPVEESRDRLSETHRSVLALMDMTEDPLFASETEPYDVHLKSKSGRYIGPGLWVSDSVSSPCIDAGDPDEPFTAEPQPNGNRVNIGMYGNTPEASKRVWGLFLLVR